MEKRCDVCVGGGKVMGGGMIFAMCKKCDGNGKIILKDVSTEIKVSDEVLKKVDRRSKEYREAIKGIMVANDKISEADARIIFDREFSRIAQEKKI